MKKLYRILLLLVLLLFSGCSRLDQLSWDMTPEKWLGTHSYYSVNIGNINFILAEPSSTAIVYGLGIIIVLAGIYFLRNRGNSKSRLWWGVALLLWGASTFCAGTSYQAFSYEIKCAGRTVCLWTSWWEIWYLILFVISMNVITIAVAFSSSSGKILKGLIGYAVANCVTYLSVVLAGALIPHQFMASFECMLLFASPTFLILLTVNSIRYMKLRKQLDILLVGAWVFMLLIVLAYFVFYISGYADILWKNGFWFNANDVLHIGLIIWIFYLVFTVAEKIEDAPKE